MDNKESISNSQVASKQNLSQINNTQSVQENPIKQAAELRNPMNQPLLDKSKKPSNLDSNQQNINSTTEQPNEKVTVLLDGIEMAIDNIHVTIQQEINQHVVAHVTGMVQAGIYDEYVKIANASKKLTIQHMIKGKRSLIYEGLLVKIQSRAESAKEHLGVYHIEIQSLSHTAQLDIKKINRSFQDITMLYDDLIQEVIQDYEGVDCMIHAPKGIAQEVFILQYLDTDWEFLTREISKFEEGLFADATLPAPKFHVGTPEGIDRGQLEEYEYTISKYLNYFGQYDQNKYENAITELDFLHYEIFDAYATDTFHLGDHVTYKDISLYIAYVYSEIKDNKLYNTYHLKTKNGLKMPRLANGDIQGLSIPGQVIDVKENLLKLHLEIDEEQPIETAYWFDYAAFYATWYCMPEINDIVNLHIPTLNEQDAIGLNSFKQNPEGGYKRNNQPEIPPNTSAQGKPGPIDFEKSAKDPDVKILTTKAGRMIQLGPDSITIEYDAGTFLVLHDTDGIVLETDQDISLHATGKIQAYAQENIELEATTKITMRNQASSIEIDPSSIVIRSADTKMN